jgi:hypothetical protein
LAISLTLREVCDSTDSSPTIHLLQAVVVEFEDPENNNRAIIKNKEGKEQVFFVSINSFKDKNLFLVSFVNISFLDSDDNCIVFDNPGEKIGEVLQFINKLFDNGLDPEKAKEIKYIEKVLLDR